MSEVSAESNETPTEALAAARLRRDALKQAISQVEIASSAPSGEPEWKSALLAELEVLERAVEEHAEEVEGEAGLLTQLTTDAPRLSNQLERLRQEHPQLLDTVHSVIEHTKNSRDPSAIRSEVMTALISLVRHRQKGADLVYEVYSVDIGGG